MEYRRIYEAYGNPPKAGPYNPSEGIYADHEPKDLEDRRQKRVNLSYGLRNKLLGHLQSGSLIAIGVMIHPEIKTEPEIIPASFFSQVSGGTDTDIWERNMFEGKTAHFEKVRVSDPSSVDPELEAEKPRVGRPSEEETIWKAYEECKASNEIDFGGFQIRAIEKVIDRLRKYHPEKYGDRGKGFGKEAVRKVIGQDFDANSLK